MPTKHEKSQGFKKNPRPLESGELPSQPGDDCWTWASGLCESGRRQGTSDRFVGRCQLFGGFPKIRSQPPKKTTEHDDDDADEYDDDEYDDGHDDEYDDEYDDDHDDEYDDDDDDKDDDDDDDDDDHDDGTAGQRRQR